MTVADMTPASAIPREPLAVSELGVDAGIVRDLVLKTMFYQGRFTRSGLTEALKVSVAVVDELLQVLVRDGLASVLASENLNASAHVYALTQNGLQRAEETLARNAYVGPVPVSLNAYIEQVRAQSATAMGIDRAGLDAALDSLVLPDETKRRIVWAVASHRPLLIHGASGNGKTTLARNIAAAIGGTVQIPYAIEVVGQIIRVFDASKHHAVGAGDTGADDLLKIRHDRRWVEVERPVVWAGGELTRHSLELVYDTETRIYESPLQLKANGGVLIIDDLGRQQMPAVQLLNRWIVALESSVDHLTLHTGQMIEVPFDVLLLFSTNLPPQNLADEAFLRRIRYKVQVDDPSVDDFREIFRRECASRDIATNDAIVDHLLVRWYHGGRPIRGCHARDLVEAVVDSTRSMSAGPPVLTTEAIDEACASYFL